MSAILSPHEIENLRAIDTPTIANAIESFNLRMRDEGYTDQSVICRSSQVQAMVGYAVTLQMRSATSPTHGTHYLDRSDWWRKLEEIPAPRILVIQDMDSPCGAGALAGAAHGAIYKTLGCIGIATNGALRDIPDLAALELHVYSGSLVASHAYAHIIEIGMPVVIGGLAIQAGDLLHGDVHGIVSIPRAITGQIRERAVKSKQHENAIRQFCTSPEFSLAGLQHLLRSL